IIDADKILDLGGLDGKDTAKRNGVDRVAEPDVKNHSHIFSIKSVRKYFRIAAVVAQQVLPFNEYLGLHGTDLVHVWGSNRLARANSIGKFLPASPQRRFETDHGAGILR